MRRPKARVRRVAVNGANSLSLARLISRRAILGDGLAKGFQRISDCRTRDTTLMNLNDGILPSAPARKAFPRGQISSPTLVPAVSGGRFCLASDCRKSRFRVFTEEGAVTRASCTSKLHRRVAVPIRGRMQLPACPSVRA